MALRFVWDARKAAENARKHRVTFTEATTVFDDRLSVTIPDPDHSIGEQRFLLLGMSNRGRLLVVAHAERDATIRIINARRADREKRDERMKKKTKGTAPTGRDTMRPSYDFRGGVRGKYVSRYRAGTNVVVLDPDISEAFPNAAAVNRALRALLSAVPPRPAKRRSA
jgi:uncharacterized protein